MRHCKITFLLITFILICSNVCWAQKRSTHRYKPYSTPLSPVDTRWANAHSPWDFSGQLVIFNPGFGAGGRAAYRVLDSVLEDVDDSLSAEAGLSYVGASNTYGGLSVSYSLVEMPILARWDFRFANEKFVVGPDAGFSYIFGTNLTVNNVSYNPGTGLFFLIGGFAMYRFNDNWAGRADLNVGGYTSFRIGVSYFL